MYSAKEKAIIINKAQVMLNDGFSINAISKEVGVPDKTITRWLNEMSEKDKECQDNRTHAEKVDAFLEEIKRDQEEIIRMAAKRVKETINDCNGQVASNVLNTTYNNYRVACGKSNEIIEVRDWTSFIDELQGRDNNN